MSLQFLKKIKRNYQDYGLFITIRKCLGMIVKPLFTKITYRIYLINLSSFSLKTPLSKKFIFRPIQGYESDIIQQIESLEEWLSGEVTKKLEKGGLCMVALDETRVAGFNLIHFEEINFPLIHFRKSLRKWESYSEQITVNKQYRGMGLASNLRYAIFDELKKRGIRKLYGGAQKDNIASLKLAKRVGFKFLADISYFRVLLCRRFNFKRVS